MIKVEHIGKKYRKKIAVDNLTFEVKTGKVTGFLGPNGAGKSTTMRLMLGLDIGLGNTTYDGKHLHEYARPSKVVGILLEAKAFHPTRTARNHLEVLAEAGDIPLRRVDEVLGIVGLTDVANRRPGKFSLGMSQRLGIAAAILGSPKYLLLDEPANGLDPEGIAWLRQFIKDYADQNNGVFVSSHLLSEMSQMADNVVVIGKGRLITETSIKGLISRSSHSSIFVRASSLSQLEKLFKRNKWEYQKEDGGLRATGLQTDEIGKAAFASGLTILELTVSSASLEEAFLELTADSEEYRAQTEVKK